MAANPDRRVTRAVYAAFVTVTVVFVGSITAQVARQLFAPASAHAVPLSPACASGVRDLYAAVDLALEVGVKGHDPDAETAAARYRAARDAQWQKKGAVEATCAGEPGGPDAVAAVARLDRLAEAVVRRQTVELRAVRREVDSFIK